MLEPTSHIEKGVNGPSVAEFPLSPDDDMCFQISHVSELHLNISTLCQPVLITAYSYSVLLVCRARLSYVLHGFTSTQVALTGK